MKADIDKLHEVYCAETGLRVSLPVSRMYQYEEFLRRGFSCEDLRLVIRCLKKQIVCGRRHISCMSFHRLIGDIDSFEEFLAEFRSLQAKRQQQYTPGKAQVLRDTGRPDAPEVQAQQAGKVLEGLKIAARLREFRKKL